MPTSCLDTLLPLLSLSTYVGPLAKGTLFEVWSHPLDFESLTEVHEIIVKKFHNPHPLPLNSPPVPGSREQKEGEKRFVNCLPFQSWLLVYLSSSSGTRIHLLPHPFLVGFRGEVEVERTTPGHSRQIVTNLPEIHRNTFPDGRFYHWTQLLIPPSFP